MSVELNDDDVDDDDENKRATRIARKKMPLSDGTTVFTARNMHKQNVVYKWKLTILCGAD